MFLTARRSTTASPICKMLTEDGLRGATIQCEISHGFRSSPIERENRSVTITEGFLLWTRTVSGRHDSTSWFAFHMSPVWRNDDYGNQTCERFGLYLYHSLWIRTVSKRNQNYQESKGSIYLVEWRISDKTEIRRDRDIRRVLSERKELRLTMTYQDYLEKVYYDSRHSGSFGGVDKLYVRKNGRYVLGKAKIRKWLETQETFGLHRQINRKFSRRKVIAPFIEYQWDADTAVMKSLTKDNDGYGYLLLAIDVFSHYMRTFPPQNYTGQRNGLHFDFEQNISGRK